MLVAGRGLNDTCAHTLVRELRAKLPPAAVAAFAIHPAKLAQSTENLRLNIHISTIEWSTPNVSISQIDLWLAEICWKAMRVRGLELRLSDGYFSI